MGARMGLVVAAAAVALATTGCAEGSKPPPTAEITRAEWREANVGFWPFTVDEGVLTCHAPDRVTFTANGTEYALSDSARWVGHYPSVSPILAEGYVAIGNERQPVPTRSSR